MLRGGKRGQIPIFNDEFDVVEQNMEETPVED